MEFSALKVLFNSQGNPLKPELINSSIINFGSSYNKTVLKVIYNSCVGLNRKNFFENVAILMPNFKMTRRGPFKGIKFSNGQVEDLEHQIEKCWIGVGDDVVGLRDFFDLKSLGKRERLLVEMPIGVKEEVFNRLRIIFNKLVPICMGKSSYGLVGASKVLFAVLPEVALPVDNIQWQELFRTIDYGEIVSQMTKEIEQWEDEVNKTLNECNPYIDFTLPAIYNVMAMKARPKNFV